MEEENKRLDFDAPLLSVRRFSGEPEAKRCGGDGDTRGKPAPPPRPASLPFYKPDLKSGPVGKPGIVPFYWEHSPGRPKHGPPPVSVRTRPKPPPGRILKQPVPEPKLERDPLPETAGEGEVAVEAPESSASGKDAILDEVPEQEPESRDEQDGEEDDRFTDALDTLSRTESFFMNCSVSGLSGVGYAAAPPGGFSTDPQVRDFMMGRFLPAAQAMSTSSPQCASRKAATPARESSRMGERAANWHPRRQALPITYQYRANQALQYAHEQREQGRSFEDVDDGEDEDCYGGNKACGLLPKLCLKGSFLLMNPAPGMKAPGRFPSPRSRRVNGPQIKSGQAEDEYSWEAVYKHKLVQGSRFQLENEKKVMTESNQLMSWSDSQDGSSPYQISSYRNGSPQSLFNEGKGFLGVPERERKSSKDTSFGSCEKDDEQYWDLTPRDSSTKGSGSMSPAMEKTLFVDSMCIPETPHSKSSSLGTVTDLNGIVNSAEDSNVGAGSGKIEETLAVESCNRDERDSKIDEVFDPEVPICKEQPNRWEMESNKELKDNRSVNIPLAVDSEAPVKNNASPMHSLLPPPLPRPPTESWLSHALPSVSSKNPPLQSLLGIQVQPKKQPLQDFTTYPNPETKAKPAKQNRQIRFAEVLTKPFSPQSEI